MVPNILSISTLEYREVSIGDIICCSCTRDDLTASDSAESSDDLVAKETLKVMAMISCSIMAVANSQRIVTRF